MKLFQAMHAGGIAIVRANDEETAKTLIGRRVRDAFTAAYDRANDRLNAALRAKAGAAFMGDLMTRARDLCPDEWLAAQEAHALLSSATKPGRDIAVTEIVLDGPAEIVAMISPRV